MNRLTQWTGAPLGVLALFLTASLMFVGCDTTVNNVNSDEPVEATGTVTGRVIDRVSSEPIQGATVKIAAPQTSADTSASSTLSATTNANGKFVISGVPANTASGASNSSTTYSVHLTTPQGSPYRQFYRAEVELAFGSAGDDPATNLSASVTFPLSKTNGTVSGRAYTNAGPLANAEIGFVQQLPVQFDGDGNATQTSQVLTATTTTDGQGNFTLNNVEVGTNFDLSVRVGNGSGTFFSGSVPETNGATVKVGEQNVTSAIPPFRITSVSPKPNSDVSTAQPDITFTFNRPVVDNEYTRDDISGDVEGSFIEELNLFPDLKKDLRSDGNLAIDISFDSTRTELTVTPSDPLSDGYIYEFDGDGFSDAKFTDAYGITLSNHSRGDFNFSVGLDDSKPATPSVNLEFGKPTLNYFSNTTIGVDFEVDVDNSQAPVKGYEVYARTVDFTGERTGTGTQFKKINNVSPVASSAEFDDEDGIVPANEAEFGTLSFDANLDAAFNGDDTPLHADDGTYGPIEWKVRAVSINNVRSDFTSVITTPDNVRPDLTSTGVGLGTVVGAYTVDDDGDGDVELVVQFDEPVDKSSIASDASQFTVYDDGTNNVESGALSGVNRIENELNPGTFAATVVVIEIDEANYDVAANSSDDLVIADTESSSNPVTDLAGNSVVENANANAGTPIDTDIEN